jgi:hypothetical protein
MLSVILTIAGLDSVWCNIMHRRWHWHRIKGFMLVCDKCGREWRE